MAGNTNIKPGLLTSIGVPEIDSILFGGGSTASSSNASASGVSNHGAGASSSGAAASTNGSGQQHSPPYSAGGGRTGWSSLSPPLPGLSGLLEVEPLHVTLHTASDGTKLQRAASGETLLSFNDSTFSSCIVKFLGLYCKVLIPLLLFTFIHYF